MIGWCIFLYCMGGLSVWCAATVRDWECQWYGINVMAVACMAWPVTVILWFVAIIEETIERDM